ncbi:hypothetical protein BDZ97DRAFT_2006551 [Flammula alnicola]|nr:hypothetical protein BDZ97DRAFT_2006551 [Flammula alnicola]
MISGSATSSAGTQHLREGGPPSDSGDTAQYVDFVPPTALPDPVRSATGAYRSAMNTLHLLEDARLLASPTNGSSTFLHQNRLSWTSTNPHIPFRGAGSSRVNVGMLVFLILALLCLFIFYLVLRFFGDQKQNQAIEGNIRINPTARAPVLFQMPELVDAEMPPDARTRTGF